MDKAGEQQRLQSELREIEAYLNHAITRSIISDNGEQQNALLDIILDRQVDSVSSLVAHFEAIGHLRGLKRALSSLQERVEEIKEQLKAT